MKAFWSRLGGQLGVGCCLAGFLLIFLGWNGAASRDRVPAQFPYLISGGIAGLALVLVGVALVIVQNQRADRAALQESIVEVLRAMEGVTGVSGDGRAARARQVIAAAEAAGMVLAGRTSFHRPQCPLVQQRDEIVSTTPEQAAADGLEPCRVCRPPATTELAPATRSRRPARARKG